MTPPSTRRPSVALAVALLALVVAVSGTSYALSQLPKNSVGSKQVKNHSLKAKDLSPAVGPTVIVRRHPGQKTIDLAAGSHANLATISLPAGKWVISGRTNGFYDGALAVTFNCYFMFGSEPGVTRSTLGLGTTGGGVRAGIFDAHDVLVTSIQRKVTLRCDHEQVAVDADYGPWFYGTLIEARKAGGLTTVDD